MDRQLDKYSAGSTLNQRDITHMSSTTTIGYTGIYNPANSCFMNAALQCLSNTRELRDYFLRMKYSFKKKLIMIFFFLVLNRIILSC